MNDFLDAAAALADLLERENAALRVHDFAATANLAEAKRKLSNRITAQNDIVMPSRQQAASSGAYANLRARLEKALAENKQLLEAAMNIQTQVIGIVLQAIEAPAVPNYQENGTQVASISPVALTLQA
jgi:predicted transcriptional regulator